MIIFRNVMLVQTWCRRSCRCGVGSQDKNEEKVEISIEK